MTPQERAEHIASLVAAVHHALHGESLQDSLMALLINVQAIFDVCDGEPAPPQVRRAYAPLQLEIARFIRAGKQALLKPLVN